MWPPRSGAAPPGPTPALPPGRGRGSSVSSIICYLIGLSHVDPVKTNLFLGHFLNEAMQSVPDIDLDFPRDIREQLILPGLRALRRRAHGTRVHVSHVPSEIDAP